MSDPAIPTLPIRDPALQEDFQASLSVEVNKSNAMWGWIAAAC